MNEPNQLKPSAVTFKRHAHLYTLISTVWTVFTVLAVSFVRDNQDKTEQGSALIVQQEDARPTTLRTLIFFLLIGVVLEVVFVLNLIQRGVSAFGGCAVIGGAFWLAWVFRVYFRERGLRNSDS